MLWPARKLVLSRHSTNLFRVLLVYFQSLPFLADSNLTLSFQLSILFSSYLFMGIGYNFWENHFPPLFFLPFLLSCFFSASSFLFCFLSCGFSNCLCTSAGVACLLPNLSGVRGFLPYSLSNSWMVSWVMGSLSRSNHLQNNIYMSCFANFIGGL